MLQVHNATGQRGLFIGRYTIYFPFILIYDIFNSINRKLARVALPLKYGQGRTEYCIPIHTEPQRSVEKTEMIINDKVCMTVNVCVSVCVGLLLEHKGAQY